MAKRKSSLPKVRLRELPHLYLDRKPQVLSAEDREQRRDRLQREEFPTNSALWRTGGIMANNVSRDGEPTYLFIGGLLDGQLIATRGQALYLGTHSLHGLLFKCQYHKYQVLIGEHHLEVYGCNGLTSRDVLLALAQGYRHAASGRREGWVAPSGQQEQEASLESGQRAYLQDGEGE